MVWAVALSRDLGVTFVTVSRSPLFICAASAKRRRTVRRLAALEELSLHVRCSLLGWPPESRRVGPSSIPSLSYGVMLGAAWIDRPVDTRDCTPASTSLPVQHERAAMPVPPATGDLTSALAP
jgi:hypothetical protein